MTWRVRALRWFLNFPILYKVLISSTALTIIGIATGFWLGTAYEPGNLVRTAVWLESVAVLGILALTLINYFIVRAALQPVSMLAQLVEALKAGHTRVRVEPPLFGDRQSTLLVETTNRLLDEITAYRRHAEELSKVTTEQLETERRSIARELHDETAQNLAALLVLLQMAARAQSEETRLAALEEVRNLAKSTLEGVRRISAGLRPVLLDNVGLSDALRWYIFELMGSVLPAVTLEMDESLGRLSPVKETALYRISQEALSNISRHAKSERASLSLYRNGTDVVLRITDEGVGFDASRAPTEIGAAEHMGLFTIRERARLAGGAATITSRPGGGTTVLVRVPSTESPAETRKRQ